jgi:hypothetical protein
MSKLFFQLYNPTGMINQVMSMELAVGLAHETGSETVVHYLSNEGDNLYDFKKVPIFTPSRWFNGQRDGFTDPNQFPHLSDILKWDKDMVLIDQKIPNFPQEKVLYDNVMNDNYYSSEPTITAEETSFAEGRQRLDLSQDTHLKFTLGWYSRFFFNRSPELDKVLASVDFKPEYYEFANMVASSIGKFQGGHLRLSDHLKMFNTTREMFEYGLTRLEQNGLPIVISTDDPNHEMVVQNSHRFILLDQYIVNRFAKEFHELQFQDEVIFGLICNLVMHKSEHFIGTSGSTYTGYIQRKRNQHGLLETWDFWDQPDKSFNGPFTFNNYNLENGRKMWWREWEESKLKL